MEFIELFFYLLEALFSAGYWYNEPINSEGLNDTRFIHKLKQFFNGLFYLNVAILLVYGMLLFLYPSQFKNWNTYLVIGVTLIVIFLKYIFKNKKI
jgi:hypothetical protein